MHFQRFSLAPFTHGLGNVRLATHRLGVGAGLAVLASLLVGCASTVVQPGPYHIPENALSLPVDFSQVCVLDNPAVKNPQLVDAIVDGIVATGAKYVPLPSDAGPQACSYVMTYDITYEGRLVKAMTFYTFENGIPIYSARGTPDGNGGVTYDMVSEYVQLVIERSKSGRARTGGPQPKKPEAKTSDATIPASPNAPSAPITEPSGSGLTEPILATEAELNTPH